jgi:probable HAF family extracellular repeat protein
MAPHSAHRRTLRAYHPLALTVAFMLLAAFAPAPSASAQVAAIDLGTLGGPSSYAVAINEQGQIIGDSITASGDVHGFLWQDGVMTDLGTLGGSFSVVRAINSAGQIVGQSATATGDYHAFLWQDGVMTDLGTLGGSWADVSGINERGQVAGTSTTAAIQRHGFVWQDGVITDLGTLGGSESTVTAINSAGQIVGQSATATGDYHAFLWQDGVMTDLGVSRAPTAINDFGQVVGYGYQWENGVATVLETPSHASSVGEPVDINNAGQSVGSYNIERLEWHCTRGYICGFVAVYVPQAALWNNAKYVRVSGLWADTSSAVAINDCGYVIGHRAASRNAPQAAFGWHNGKVTSFAGRVRALNNAGQVVGTNDLSHAVLWTVPAASCLDAPNRLANPGFEEDANNDGRPDAWSSNTRFTRSGEVVHSGSFAGKHAATDNGWYTISQAVNQVMANVPYHFSGRVNIPPTTARFQLKLQVRWRNALNWPIGTSPIAAYTGATDGWQEVTANLVVPSGTTHAEVQMVVQSLDTTIYVDDFTLSFGAVSSPTTAIVALPDTPSEATSDTPVEATPDTPVEALPETLQPTE